MKKYVLIDGAFFEGICKEFGRKNDFSVFDNINWLAVKADAERLIYFDALPVKKDKQTQEEFDEVLAKKSGILNVIRRTDGCHVRDGLTRLKTRARRELVEQVYEQKGVDTWIAIEALQYAMRGISDEIHIYTSDADLYPLFEAFQQTNCKGILHFAEGRARDELIFSADAARPITISRMKDWASVAIPPHFRRFETELDGAKHIPIFTQESNNGTIIFEYDVYNNAWYLCREVEGRRIDGVYSEYIMILIDRARGWAPGFSYEMISEFEARRKGK